MKKRETCGWLDNLKETELILLLDDPVRELVQRVALSDTDLELVGKALVSPIAGLGDIGKKEKILNLWECILREIHVLICTNNPKYSDLRRKLDSHIKGSAEMGLVAISGVMGAVIGVSAAVLTPLIVLVFIMVLRIGREVWCERWRDSITKQEKKKRRKR